MSFARPELRVLQGGEPAPGKWVKDSKSKTSQWSGMVSWLTEHGDAAIEWTLGKPQRIWNARSPDGAVVSFCEVSSPNDPDLWRRPNPSGRGYIAGAVEIKTDGIAFTDHPSTTPELPAPDPDRLGACLALDGQFLMRIQDDEFAAAVNEYLRNREFRRDATSEGRWALTWRSIGGLVADLRGIGESYLDFYLGDRQFRPEHTVEFEEMLERMGWHALTPEEYARDHQVSIAILYEVELRPEGSVPTEERPRIYRLEPARKARDDGGLVSRMHRAARQGRVTEAEFDRFFSHLDLDNERTGADVPPALPH